MTLWQRNNQFCSEKKSTLEPGELLVIGDFAENYGFVMQNAVQGFHWTNTQATLHPWVVYYKDSGELKHVSVVIISDCLAHDAAAVKLYQKKLIQFLKLQNIPMQKITYMSDGAASQYKNCKNFINLCHHQKDYGIEGEWHFFATSHGKGPCDGVGGTVKWLAARASLQRPDDDHIMNDSSSAV